MHTTEGITVHTTEGGGMEHGLSLAAGIMASHFLSAGALVFRPSGSLSSRMAYSLVPNSPRPSFTTTYSGNVESMRLKRLLSWR